MASAAPVEKIDIGRVITRTFEAAWGNFGSFFLASALLAGLPAFFWQYWMMAGMEAALDDPEAILRWSYWGPFFLGLLVMMVAWALLQGVLVRSTVFFLSGRAPDFRQSALVALRLILPIILVSIVVSVLMTLGFICLIVPGFMIYCAFSVAVPALVEEQGGVFGSLERSRNLTRGSRKRIFVIAFVFWILSFMLSSALGAFNGLSTMGDFSALPNPILAGLVAAVSSALSSVIVAVSVSALYVELRTVKEGASTSDLAAVFE
jgi:hypothetical protein